MASINCRLEKIPKLDLNHGLPTPSLSPIDQALNPFETQTQLPVMATINQQDYRSDEELVEEIATSLKKSGGCIIRNMIPHDVLQSLESEIRPHLNATEDAAESREAFVPASTRMVTGLLSKSRSHALNIVGNEVWQKVGEYFLTSTLSNFWHGDKQHTSKSLPQLSTTVTFSVGPGTQAQSLHRDDDIYHTYHPASTSHVIGRDTMICFFVAGTKTTKANGATRIIPGSHLWDYSRPPPSSDDPSIQVAELNPGDAFMMLGGCFHGAGANVTQNEERLVYASFTTRGYLRQEENQYLANDLQKIQDLPPRIQRFAGFGSSKPFMGWVDLKEPMKTWTSQEFDSEEDFW